MKKSFEKVENLNPAFRWRDVPRAIWYFLEGERAKFVIALVFLFLIFFYELIPAYVVGKIVDFFTNYHAGDSFRTFYIYIGFLGITIPLAAVIRIESRKVLHFAGFRMRARARIWGIERLTEYSMQWHAQENSGNKIQKIFTGGLALKDWSKIIGGDLLSVGAYTIGILFFFFFASPVFALWLFVYMLVFLLVEFFFNKRMMRLSDRFNKLDQEAAGIYIEGAGNMLALKALGGEHQLHGRVKMNEQRTQELSILRSKAGFDKWRIFRFVDGPAIIIFFLLIRHGILASTISVGTILVFFAYFVRLNDVRGKISDTDEIIIDLKSGLGNMMPIFWEETHAPTGKDPFPRDWHKVMIKGGHFAYPSGQVGMQDFDFELRRGEKLGIAGTSGSGKSSLVKILLGLYKIQQGSFTVDQTNFYDISHEDLMRHVSVVLQETELFNMSLQDNITMMRDLNPVLLERAIEVSQLRDVIDKLSEGVNSLIGEKGYMLSGGERQRLGIARAIYKNAPIMILDEATSALDVETERQIMEKLLRDDAGDHTFMAIAHRQSTLDYTDRVITIEHGTVV